MFSRQVKGSEVWQTNLSSLREHLLGNTCAARLQALRFAADGGWFICQALPITTTKK